MCDTCVWAGEGGSGNSKEPKTLCKGFQELTIFHPDSACDFPNLFPANSHSPACEGTLCGRAAERLKLVVTES